MIANSAHELFMPYFLEPVDLIVRILFDRVISASIIMSVLYCTILLARHVFKNNITPYVRYCIWFIMLAGLFLSRSTFLPMVILNPVYTVMADYFGISYNQQCS